MDDSKLLDSADAPVIDEEAILAKALESTEVLDVNAEQPLQDTLNGAWVLIVYCLFSTFQCTLWAIPGPVSTTMAAVYPNSITPFDIQLFLNWGAICFIPCAPPFAYWLARPHGIRRCTILGVVLITLGAACRCGAQTDSTLSLILWHLSSILIGCAGPIAMAAPSLLAETWFLPRHRGLAMALAAEANSIGGAIAFAMPPALLSANTLHDLNHVYEVCLGLCLFTAVCCLYFPDAPSVPPSRSAVAEGSASQAVTLASMWTAAVRIARNPQMCLIVSVYAITNGFNSAWSATLNLNLSHIGVSQNMAGYLGAASTVAGNVAGVLCGLYVDRFHRMKPTLVALNIVNVAALIGFALFVQPSLVSSLSPTLVLAGIWVTTVSSGLALNGAIPLFFEVAVESAFPVSTAFVIMFCTVVYNACTLVMLFVPVSSAATAFNWTYVAGCAAATLALWVWYKEQSKRYDFDSAGVRPQADGAPYDEGGRCASISGIGLRQVHQATDGGPVRQLSGRWSLQSESVAA